MLKCLKIKIVPDECPTNPRDWDNLGVMACWHRRHVLGDIQPGDPSEHMNSLKDIAVILPIYGYDHSGVFISTQVEPTWFHYRWDGGQLGWIYVTRDGILKDFDRKRLSKKLLARVRRILQQEVKIYSQYLTGEVFGFEITDQDGEHKASCYGYYDSDQARADAEDLVPHITD